MKLWLVPVLLVPAACAAAPVTAVPASLKVDKTSLDGFNTDRVVGFAVDAEGRAWFATPGGAYQVAGGELRPMDVGPFESLRGLTVAPGGPAFISGAGLYLWKGGTAIELADGLPPTARVAAAGDHLFIAEAALHVCLPGSGHQRLIDLPGTVDAMTGDGGKVYFSIGPTIYSLALGAPLAATGVVPGVDRIVSLAVDAAEGVTYLCDGKSLIALQENPPRLILLSRGGTQWLHFRDGSLYVLSRKPSALYRIQGISRYLKSGQASLLDLTK